MSWYDFLFGAAPAVEKFRADAITANVTALANAIANEAVIRMYVDRGGGTGQQAAAINLLKRIIAPVVPVAPNTPPGLGYTGAGKTAQLIYDDSTATTLANLQRLLGFAAGLTRGPFLNLQVVLLPLSAPGVLALVGYSFSAATDGNADTAFETICVASLHLRLQPFMYGTPTNEQLRFAAPAAEVIGLTTRAELGGASFHELGFYLPTSLLDDPAWNAFEARATGNADQLRRIRVLRALVTGQYVQGPGQLVKQYDLLFTYGIHTTLWRGGATLQVNAIGVTPTDQVVELTLGVMATQLDSEGRAVSGAIPAVIVNLDDFWYDDMYFRAAERAADDAPSIFREVERLLAGGRVRGEPDPAAAPVVPAPPANIQAIRRARLQVLAFRQAYLQAVGLRAAAGAPAPPARFTGLDDPTLLAATAAVVALLAAPNANRAVLWVQLAPPFPADLFNALLGRSTLPAVFEGANTANQALAFPRIYYNTSRPQTRDIRYPSEVLATRPGEALLRTLQTAANQVGLPLARWPNSNNAATWPPEVFAGPIRDWRAEPVLPPLGKYHRYFKGISEFFRQVTNDKYSLAFAFLGQEVVARAAPAPPVALNALLVREDGGTLAAGGGTLLADLYAALNNNLKGATLALLPGALAPSSKIAQLLSGVLGLADVAWTLDHAAIATQGGAPRPDDGGSITVTGGFSVGDVGLNAQMVFTVAGGALAAEVTLTATSAPEPLPGLQWSPFASVGMVIGGGNGAALPVVQATAELQWPGSADGFSVSWPVALADGAFKVTGDFHPGLSLDYAFKLAGGVNLIAQVPPPFSALTGLAVTGLEIGYDTTTASTTFVSVLASYTGAPVRLLPVLALDDLMMVLSVAKPGDPTSRAVQAAIQGSFNLGHGTVQIAADLPDMVFSGQLVDGQITLSDLIAFFTLGVVITPDTTTVIDALAFDYDARGGTGSLAVDLNADWSISPAGIPALVVESLGLTVQIGAPETSGSRYSGLLTGVFTLLEGTPSEIGLQVSAGWDPAAGWRFTAKQTSGTLMLLTFITTYLGGQFTFDHDLALSGVEITLAPGVKGSAPPLYTFKLQTAAAFKVDFLGLSIPKVTAEIGYQGPVAPEMAEVSPAAAAAFTLPREDPPPIRGLPLSAAARVRYRQRASARSRMAVLATSAGDGNGQQGLYGSLAGEVNWHGVTLNLTYGFQKPSGGDTDQKVGLEVILSGQPFASATLDRTGGATMATFQFGQDTLGGVVETFVSWATGQSFGLGAPWNLLDSIPLDNFEVIFHFDTKIVDFTWKIGPIVIGPAVIDSIDLTYNAGGDPNQPKVGVTLKGTFPWQTGAKADTLKWDAADPSSTQAPPGGGNKYFDLRMLALGQHLALTSTGRIDSVAPLVAALSDLVPPDGKGVPVPMTSQPTNANDPPLTLDYSANGGWLVAADFGILKIGDDDPNAGDGYVVQFSAVFDDPVLYAARVALDGKAAKIFAGLEFQIIYQQVSNTAGVWRARIALPTSLRTFEAGAMTITLPEFGVGIYTNGDFEVDIGFPWNMDFSVSFTVAAIIAGFPVMGSGGLYFAKLSDATKSQAPPGSSVPAAINGTFNPIIAFGFGAQFGLGKSLSMGVLKAGFALTAFGIVQGVVAKWHPYPGSGSGAGGTTELQGEYYFQLTGTFGLIGKLYGSLDFVIVSASLDININIYVQISYTSYQPIVLTAVASVDVELTVTIDLGLFKIHLHFGFSATVKATFEMQIGSDTPPWQIAAPTGPTPILYAPPQTRLFARSGLLAADVVTPVWAGKLADTDPSARPTLTGHLMPTLTATGDAAKTLSDQTACYVALLLLDAPAPVAPGGGQAADDGSAFESLCRLVGAWIGAAVQADAGIPLSQLWTRSVTEAQLKAVVDALSGDDPFPIPLDAIDAFMAGQTAVTLTVPPSTNQATTPQGVVFPPPPQLTLTAPGISYSFGGLTTTDPTYLSQLKALFNRLAVQVEQEVADAGPKLEALGAAGPSVAGFVYGAWFALLARQMTNAMLQGLRAFQYDPAINGKANGTLAAMLADLNVQLGGADPVDAPTLLVANGRHPLNTGKALGVTGALLTAGDGETFAMVAARAFSPLSGAYFDGPTLAALNPDAPMTESAAFTFNGAAQVTQSSDTLTKLAQRLAGGVVATLLSSSDIVAKVALVTAAPLAAPAFAYVTVASDVLEDLAGRFKVGVESFASSPNLDTATGLFVFDTDQNRFLAAPHLTAACVGALVDEAQRSGAFRQASGMLSRFMLHGLRLQTGPVTPTAPALFVGGAPGAYGYTVPEAGLYVLTGQQFALPAPFPANYQVSLSQSAKTWLTLGATDGLSAVYKVSDFATEQARVSALQSWLSANLLNVGVDAIGPEAAIGKAAASYSVKSAAPWINLGRVTLPVGNDVAANSGLTLLQLPPELTALASQTVTVNNADGSRKVVMPGAPPAFDLTLQRYDEVTAQTVQLPVGAYGWASLVTLNIRRAVGAAAAADTYELIGAGEADIQVLERLLEAIGDSDSSLAGLAVLYPSAAKAASGLISDDFANVRTGLIQSNLTTVTLPPGGGPRALDALAEAPAPWADVYNSTIAEFLRFTWEASITRSGGFYLYYYDTTRQAGLPDAMFNDQGEGKVNLLVVCRDAAAAPSYVNCAVLGQGIAGKNVAVAAMAAQPQASISLADSLDAIALRAYLPASDAAQQLAGQALVDGKVLAVGGGLYQVISTTAVAGQPGGDPNAIATWFGTTLAALCAINQDAPSAWWTGGVPLLAALRLPTVSVIAAAASGWGTLGAIAAYWRTTVAQVGADNRTAPGLFAASSTTVVAGPVAISAIEPPGVVGYLATRAIPGDPTDAASLMASLFTMLGYTVAANQDFVRVPGLPAGPRTGGSVGRGKLRAAVADDVWRYRLTVPTYRCTARWTPGDDNPYSALGKVLQVDLQWQDLFGNRMLAPAPGAPIGPGCNNLTPATAGYTDRLIGIGGWPSMTPTWAVTKPGVITLGLAFSLARYQAGTPPPDPAPDYRTNAARDLALYEQIARQLADPNGITWSLRTSRLASGTAAIPPATVSAITALLATVQAYLGAIAAGQTPSATPAALTNLDIPWAPVAQAQVARLDVALVLARDPALVAGAAHDAPGVGSTATPLAPAIDASSGGTTGMATSLAVFAAAFETAMSSGAVKVKLAAGSDRYAGRGPLQLWMVQMADGGTGGLGFQLAPWVSGQAIAPMIYARRPISRVLVSRQAMPIWLYDGKDILAPGSVGYLARDFAQIDTETWGQLFAQAFDQILTPPYAAPALIVDARAKTSYLDRLRAAKTKVAGALSLLVIPVFDATPPLPDGALGAAQEALYQTLLEQLSNAFANDVVVQFPVTVQAVIDEPAPPNARPVPPRLFGGVAFRNSDSHATLIATGAKIDLVTATAAAPQLLTTVVTASFPAGETPPAYVIVAKDDGVFTGSNIEHQIGSLTDIVGYEASSWLGFPVPLQSDAEDPLAIAAFPAFDVPVIVRAYPANPHLYKQLGVHVQGSQSYLRQARAWTYEAVFSRDNHPPQDRLAIDVTFNHPAPSSGPSRSRLLAGAPTPPPPPDSVSALAEFVTAYPTIATALSANLLPIDPSASNDAIDQASLALGSFVALAEYVAEGMANEFGRPPIQALGAGLDGGYAFELFEGDDPFADVYVLVIDQAAPSGIGAPSVQLPDFDTVICTGCEPWTPPAYLDAITARPPTAFAFAFNVTGGSPKTPLLNREDGRQVRVRTIQLPGLDVLARQDGMMSVSVHRNPDLVPGLSTAKPFVYTTPPIAFPAPLSPSVVDSRMLLIDQLAGGKVTVTSLRGQLQALWDALFAEAPTRNTVQCSVRYVYGLGPVGLPAVSVPVLMLPSAAFVATRAQPDEGAWTEAALLDGLAAQIQNWFAAVVPTAGSALVFDQTSQSWLSAAGPVGGGVLVIDLVVMAAATGMPLLELSTLTLPIASVSPPLQTS